MARYASGKKSVAISDISGFKVKYNDLKTTWDGLRVEPQDWEPKHPQLTPAKNVIDATALFQPRVDNDPENVSFFVGFNTDIFASKIENSQKGIGIKGTGVVELLPTSSFNFGADVTGQAGTGAIGTIVPTGKRDVTGVSATATLGGIGVTDGTNVRIALLESGLAGTGAIGTEIPTVSLIETGLAGTGAIGSVNVTITELGFGGGDWGEGAWGE